MWQTPASHAPDALRRRGGEDRPGIGGPARAGDHAHQPGQHADRRPAVGGDAAEDLLTNGKTLPRPANETVEKLDLDCVNYTQTPDFNVLLGNQPFRPSDHNLETSSPKPNS